MDGDYFGVDEDDLGASIFNNVNTTVSSTLFSGQVHRNVSLVVDADANTRLELFDNTNCTVSCRGGKVRLSKSTNCTVIGSENQFGMLNEVNGSFLGEGNVGTFRNNANLVFNATDIHALAEGNMNLVINGLKSRVKALRTQNVVASASNCALDVSDVGCLDINGKSCGDQANISHNMEFIPSFNLQSNYLPNAVDTPFIKWKGELKFCNVAKIVGARYAVGIFAFTISIDPRTGATVTIREAEPQILQRKRLSLGSVLLTGEKDGKQEKLLIHGPRVISSVMKDSGSYQVMYRKIPVIVPPPSPVVEPQPLALVPVI